MERPVAEWVCSEKPLGGDPPVAGGDAHEHSGGGPGQLLQRETGVLDSLVGKLQKQSLLGVHGASLAGRDTEERVVEVVDPFQEPALRGRRCSRGHRGGGGKRSGDSNVQAEWARYSLDPGSAPARRGPDCGPLGKAAGHPHDGDRFGCFQGQSPDCDFLCLGFYPPLGKLSRGDAGSDSEMPIMAPESTTDDQDFPVTSNQLNFWLQERLRPGHPASVLVSHLKIRPDSSETVSRIYQAFSELVRRHALLRTTFPQLEGIPVGRVGPPELDFEETRLESLELILEEKRRPFQLERQSPFRIRVYRGDGSLHLLVMLHHIAGDWSSFRILFAEFLQLMERRALGALGPSFSELARREEEWLSGGEAASLLEAWKRGAGGSLRGPSPSPPATGTPSC